MSRHRRQRIRRFNRTIEAVPQATIDACIWRAEFTGKLAKHYTPVEKLAAIRAHKKTLLPRNQRRMTPFFKDWWE